MDTVCSKSMLRDSTSWKFVGQYDKVLELHGELSVLNFSLYGA